MAEEGTAPWPLWIGSATAATLLAAFVHPLLSAIAAGLLIALLLCFAIIRFRRRGRRAALREAAGGCGAGCSSADSDLGDGGASCGGGGD